MKKQIGIVMFYVAAIFLTGCIQPSLKPLFTEKDVFFDPNLVGIWMPIDSNETWEFSKIEDANAYKLVVTDDGKTGNFAAGLGQIDGYLFLDVFPNGENDNDNDLYKEHILGMHSFIWVQQIAPTLQIALVDSDKVAKIIEAEPNAVGHIKNDDRIILTADTNDLRDFVIDYGVNVDDANSIFAETMTFHHEGHEEN
jgi:hypothetical protein